MVRFLLTLLSCTLYCSTAFAESSAGSDAIYQSSDILASSFRVIWGLLIVLGIILILYALLKKRFSVFSNSSEKEIKVLEIKPLLGKKALCLVKVRGQDFLLGISDNQISHLAELTPEKKATTSFEDALQAETGDPE